MRIGFYAPLKSPNHDVPSGDRALARLLIKALQAAGYTVELLSELRSWEGTGSNNAQQNIQTQAKQEIDRLKQLYSVKTPPDLIFIYHVYHKAPDWIGIELSKHLDVPYVIAEASYAPKQTAGAWDRGHRQTLKCIKASSAIICLNPNDIECIKPLIDETQKIELLKPFLAAPPERPLNITELKNYLAKLNHLDTDKYWLITVAMMREGDKTASYKQLAETVKQLNNSAWQLIIIGDGNAAKEIKNHFSAISDHCLFVGELDRDLIYHWLFASDIYVWPAINEAFGLALLEAQACGLPAVVQDYGGVSSIVKNGKTGYMTDPKVTRKFTEALERLMANKPLQKRMAQAASINFSEQHSFESAYRRIDQLIQQINKR